MNFQEILAKLKENNISNMQIAWEDLDYEELGLGTVKKIESWGGEGEGENIGRVYLFEAYNIYMQIDGYHQSHYGSDWNNDPYEVEPKQQTVTVYEPVKTQI